MEVKYLKRVNLLKKIYGNIHIMRRDKKLNNLYLDSNVQ